MHEVQRGTGERIRHRRVAERSGQEVPATEVVRGVPVPGAVDEWVVIEPGELDAIRPDPSRAIDVQGFVPDAAIDPLYHQHTYYVGPNSREFAKTYGLLHRALAETGRAGVAEFVMRGRRRLAALRALPGGLALTVLRYPDEVRDWAGVAYLPDPDTPIAERELAMARQLISLYEVDWTPAQARDEYEEAVREIVTQRAGRGELTAAEPAATGAAELMRMLEASIQAARTEEPPTADRPKRTTRRTAKKPRPTGD